MKRWKWAALLLALCLCACTGKEPALPPPENPAPDESAVRPPEGETQALWYWKDLWDSPETRRLELDYAQSFSVDFSAGGYARIRIDQETYLLCPEDLSPPPDTPEEVVVLRQPLENIYMQATAAMDSFCRLEALDAVTLSGTRAEGWYIPEAREAMEAGRLVYAGKYNAPDYELIVSKNCGLALESTMIYHNPEVKEQLERLGIPVLVERSSYESHPLGRMEWIKLYGVLMGKLEEAEAFFDGQLERLFEGWKEKRGRACAGAGAGEYRENGCFFLHHFQRGGQRTEAGGLYCQGHRPGRGHLCVSGSGGGGKRPVHHEYADGVFLPGGQGRGHPYLQQRHRRQPDGH